MDEMQAWKPNMLQQLVENAKSHKWAVDSRKLVYKMMQN